MYLKWTFKKIIIEITETNDFVIYSRVLVSGCSKKVNASDSPETVRSLYR